MVEELLKVEGIDVTETAENVTDSKALPPIAPIHIACDMGHVEVVRLLLDHSKAAHAKKAAAVKGKGKGKGKGRQGSSKGKSKGGRGETGGKGTPEAEEGCVQVNVSALDDGATLLHIAAQNNHVEMTKLLLSTPGIELNPVMHSDKVTPFWIACTFMLAFSFLPLNPTPMCQKKK